MNYRLVGKVKEAHGLRGDLYLLVFSKEAPWANQLKDLQLRNPSGETNFNFKILTKKNYKDGLLVRLESIDDRTKAEGLKGYQFLIPENLLVSNAGEDIFLSEILGFDVFLKDQMVGIIQGFSSNGPQDLLVIRNEEHIFEVPFVKDFILKLDFENKKIVMDFPDGLMNLSEE